MRHARTSSRLFALVGVTLFAAVAIGVMFQLHVGAANADLHFKELMAGANGNSRIQFIVIEQQQGQNLWGPQAGEPESRDMLVFFDATGGETGKFKFPASPSTGGSLQTLIATQEFANLPGAPVPDVIIPPLLIPIAGKVCFKNNPANVAATSRNECVSYGSFTGDTEVNFVGNDPGVPAGPPASALPIVDTVSLRRTINTGTNSDFQLTTSPTPTNIAGASLAIVVASAIEQGGNLFNKETFQGNGRTCATCHVANDNLRLSPSNIQSRFATLASPTFSFDPLFIGESKPSSFDAGFDFNLNTLVLTSPVATPAPCTGELRGDITTANGAHGKVLARVSPTTYLVYSALNPAMTGVVTDGVCSGTVGSITAGNLAVPAGTNPPGLEDPKLMRTSSSPGFFPQGRGLILENIDGSSNPAVFRKSPHLLNLSRTGPFGLSGNIPDLQTFATGAVKQHFPRTLTRNSSGPNPDFRLPTPAETAAMEAFMRAQEFPSGNDPNKFDLDRFATTSLQRTGRAQFFGTVDQPNCSSCHGGPLLSQTTVSIQGKPIGVNASFNTGAANIIIGGDNVPCEPSASVGACNSREFSVPPLFNANSVGPFFHNASEATLANAVNFYDSSQFFNSPANVALSAKGLSISVGFAISSFLAGLTPRPYTLSPGPIRFGLQGTGAGPTASQSITVTNTSSNSISFQGCSLTGTDFSEFVITSCPLNTLLAAGQSAIVTVAFDPNTSGLKSATLEINTAVPSGIDLFGVGDVMPVAPTLTSTTANMGTADGGDSVTLTGTNFINGATVTIGGVRAGFIKVVNATSITARTGAHGAGAVDVVVTNPDGQSATLVNGFTYTTPAALSLGLIAPSSGSSLGSTITINGTGFKDGAGVTLGGTAATNVNVVTSTTMTATTPPHAAASLDLCVINLDGQQACLSNAYTFVSAPAPTVSFVTPTSGSYQGGTNVVVQGTGFSVGTTVTFGGATAFILNLSATSMTVRTAAHAPGIVDVVVTNGDGQTVTLPSGFAYLPPSISSLSPSSGSTLGGTFVSINGDGFAPGATVTFGGLPATNITFSNQTTITATTPAHAAGTVNVVVINPDGQSVNAGFNYIPPTITSVSPNSGTTVGGTRVSVSGSGFGPGATVTFGGVAGTNVSASETTVFVTTPAHVAGSVNVVVTNTNGTTTTKTNGFTYVPPAITSISPSSGTTVGGTRISIFGAGFAQGATVKFDGILGTNISVSSESTIFATTPAHSAGSVNVVVTNPDGSPATSVSGFAYVQPAITSISPNSGATAGGTSVFISGSGFGQGATVTFGGLAVTVNSISETSISITTPPHAAGSVDVIVTNTNGSAVTSVNGFTFLLPTITSISPNTGNTGGGTSVTIFGSAFAQGATVTFGGAPATNVSMGSDTVIFARTPAHASGSVNIVVTNPNGAVGTKVNGFTYVLPTITSISPSLGNTTGGTNVSISGAGFNPGAKVTFGGIVATNVSGGENFLSATTPAHAAGTVDVVVTNPNATAATSVNGYTYVLPSITSIGPGSGNTGGGTSVNISGSGFAPGATVTFGGIAATNVFVNETFISATTPAHAAGTVNVVVTNPNGTSATSFNGFSYVPPSITSISPNTGNMGGGTFVNINGSGFSSNATVTFGGTPGTNVSGSETFLSVRTPAHVAGSVNVVVTNPNGSNFTSVNGFTYVLPSITSISPTSGNTGGGTSVNINGAGFSQGATVTFGGVAATNVFVNETSISATTPAHTVGSVNVVVTNPNGNSVTSVNGFSYVLPAITSISPNSGGSNGGTFVNITGAGFAQGAAVTFGGVAATSISVIGNETTIFATTPVHATGGVNVVVTNPNGASVTSTNGFTYLPSVSVSSVSPASGSSLGASAITINGSGFASGAGVKVGGVSATNVVVVSSATITAVTGPHPAGVVDVLVTNTNGLSGTLSNAYTYVAAAPPQVGAITPGSGSSLGGTPVTINGAAFAQGATVKIGGVTATNVAFVNSGMLTAISGPHAAGLVDVVVANPDAQIGTLSNSFIYVAAAAPILSSIVPASGSTLGGTPVTIVGTGFGNGATVTIGGQPAANVTFVNSTTIVATTPARAAGVVDVVLTNADTQKVTLPGAFTYSSTPSNDNFVNRFSIVGAGSITASASNVGATSEAGEPSDLLGQGSGTPSVWWTWTATCSFSVSSPNSFINTSGSGFDTVLGLFTGSSLNSLVPFASDDDSGGNLTSQVPSSSNGGSSLNIVAGTVFQIRVRGFSNSSTGIVVLHIDSPCGITAVTPPSGPYTGGTNVTVIGSGFTNGVTLALGGVNASGINVVNSTTITATTGPHAGGPVDVTLTNANQTTTTLPNGFTFIGGPKRRGQVTSQ